MFFQKYDPRARYFDNLIELMAECGIKEYLVRRALPYKDIKEQKRHKEEKLILEYYYLVFIPVLAGMLMGAAMFVLELTKTRIISRFY